MAAPLELSILDLKRNDPRAAAAYYVSRRRAGTWHTREVEALYMLQDTKELQDELERLITTADAEFGRPT